MVACAVGEQYQYAPGFGVRVATLSREQVESRRYPSGVDIVFYMEDNGHTYATGSDFPHSAKLVFRRSVYQGGSRKYVDYAMPAFPREPIYTQHDMLMQEGSNRWRRKDRDRLPIVSFMGVVRETHQRAALIDACALSNKVVTQIVERDTFNHADTGEYVVSLMASDYVLCPHGVGAFSYRLYEALALGATPVFITCGAMLPMPQYVPWGSACVIVERPEQAPEAIASHWQRIRCSEDYERQQRRIATSWEAYLSPAGWFCTVAPMIGRLFKSRDVDNGNL
jgi:hypothetical protein